MGLRAGTLCHTLCVSWGVSRILYLLSATLVVFGFTLEMIFIGLVVAPYIRDGEFVSVACTFNSSRYNGVTDCQDVNRRPLFIPCLEVKVNFVANQSALTKALPVEKGVANIFTVLSYYEDSTTNAQCSSKICYRDLLSNIEQISNLNTSLYNGNSSFTCYVRQEAATGKFVALRTREVAEAKVFHCLLWPALCFAVGGLLLWVTYCCLGCNVWPRNVDL